MAKAKIWNIHFPGFASTASLALTAAHQLQGCSIYTWQNGNNSNPVTIFFCALGYFRFVDIYFFLEMFNVFPPYPPIHALNLFAKHWLKYGKPCELNDFLIVLNILKLPRSGYAGYGTIAWKAPISPTSTGNGAFYRKLVFAFLLHDSWYFFSFRLHFIPWRRCATGRSWIRASFPLVVVLKMNDCSSKLQILLLQMEHLQYFILKTLAEWG